VRTVFELIGKSWFREDIISPTMGEADAQLVTRNL
jgi:hypothetical protein